MTPPSNGPDQRASNRELMWLVVGTLAAGLMILITTLIGGGVGD